MTKRTHRSNTVRPAKAIRILSALLLLAGLAASSAAQPAVRRGGPAVGGPGGEGPQASVLKVDRLGGDFASITAALDSIVDAGLTDVDGFQKVYLISVAPGTYEERVVMKPYVDLAGSGQLMSKITFAGGSGVESATLVAADHSEIRSLTIESTGGSSHAVAVYSTGASPRLSNLSLVSSGANENFGLVSVAGSPQLDDVTIGVTGQGIGIGGSYGVYNESSSPVMRNVAIHVASTGGVEDVNYGVWNVASSPMIRESEIVVVGGEEDSHALHNEAGSAPMACNSTLVGETGAVYSEDSTTRLAYTQLDGGVDGDGATCIGAFDAFFRPLDGSCEMAP